MLPFFIVLIRNYACAVDCIATLRFFEQVNALTARFVIRYTVTFPFVGTLLLRCYFFALYTVNTLNWCCRTYTLYAFWWCVTNYRWLLPLRYCHFIALPARPRCRLAVVLQDYNVCVLPFAHYYYALRVRCPCLRWRLYYC